MPLPATGPIALSSLQTEFGGTSPIALSEYYAGAGIVQSSLSVVPSSGAIAMSKFYGLSASAPSALDGGQLAKISTFGGYYDYVGSHWMRIGGTYRYVSDDLLTNTSSALSPAFSPVVHSLKYFGGRIFALLSSSGTCYLRQSLDDGNTWSAVGGTSVTNGTNVWSHAVGTKGGIGAISYMSVCNMGSGNQMYTFCSLDGGATFSVVSPPTPYGSNTKMCFAPELGLGQGGDGLFIYTGYYKALYTAQDGKSWVLRQLYDSVTGQQVKTSTLALIDIAAGLVAGGVATAVGLTDTGRTFINEDSTGTTYALHPALPNAKTTSFNGKIGYGNGYYIVVGPTTLAAPYDVGMWTSADGINWTYWPQPGMTGITPTTIVYVDKFYVQSGANVFAIAS